MSPLVVAAVWAGAGIAAAALLPALRSRRAGFLVPLAGLLAVLTVPVTTAAVPGAGPPGALGLDRVAEGVVAAGAGSLVLTMLLAPGIDAAQMRTVGLAGAAVVIALSTSSAIVWAVALVGGIAVLALRWIGTSPGRATFAAGRVAIPGAAALLGAASFLPVAGVLTGPRPVLVSGLLGSGIASLAGLLPLGGWAAGAIVSVTAVDSAVWVALIAPAALLAALRLELQLPPLALAYFDGLLTALGLATALWHGINARRLAGRARYARVLLADIALAAVAAGTGHPTAGLVALLLLTVTHLTAAPLLLQEAEVRPRARRLMWLLLCGLPPGPSFWGRLAAIEALSQSSFWAMVAALVAMATLFVVTLLAALRPEHARPERSRALPALGAEAAGWLVFAGGLAAGLAPGATLALVFGVH